MEEDRNSDKHDTHWAASILCVRWKNWQEMVRNELFANPVLITWSSWTKCLQMYTQLYIQGVLWEIPRIARVDSTRREEKKFMSENLPTLKLKGLLSLENLDLQKFVN